MKNNTLKLALGIGFLFCLVASIRTQAQTTISPPDCSKLESDNPQLFITFERTERKKVILRLQNNSRCPVLIPTNEPERSLKLVRLPNGGLKPEFSEDTDLRPGSSVAVVYHLFNLRDSNDTVIVSDGCVIIPKRLLPNQAIMFAIPLSDLKRHADVGVEFTYPGEGLPGGGNVGHYVFFRNEHLPKNIR